MMVKNSDTMAREKSIISRSHNFLGTGDEEEDNEKGTLDQHVLDECVEKFSGRMMWDGEGFNKRAFPLASDFLGRKCGTKYVTMTI